MSNDSQILTIPSKVKIGDQKVIERYKVIFVSKTKAHFQQFFKV